MPPPVRAAPFAPAAAVAGCCCCCGVCVCGCGCVGGFFSPNASLITGFPAAADGALDIAAFAKRSPSALTPGRSLTKPKKKPTAWCGNDVYYVNSSLFFFFPRCRHISFSMHPWNETFGVRCSCVLRQYLHLFTPLGPSTLRGTPLRKGGSRFLLPFPEKIASGLQETAGLFIIISFATSVSSEIFRNFIFFDAPPTVAPKQELIGFVRFPFFLWLSE